MKHREDFEADRLAHPEEYVDVPYRCPWCGREGCVGDEHCWEADPESELAHPIEEYR